MDFAVSGDCTAADEESAEGAITVETAANGDETGEVERNAAACGDGAETVGPPAAMQLAASAGEVDAGVARLGAVRTGGVGSAAMGSCAKGGRAISTCCAAASEKLVCGRLTLTWPMSAKVICVEYNSATEIPPSRGLASASTLSARGISAVKSTTGGARCAPPWRYTLTKARSNALMGCLRTGVQRVIVCWPRFGCLSLAQGPCAV